MTWLTYVLVCVFMTQNSNMMNPNENYIEFKGSIFCFASPGLFVNLFEGLDLSSALSVNKIYL